MWLEREEILAYLSDTLHMFEKSSLGKNEFIEFHEIERLQWNLESIWDIVKLAYFNIFEQIKENSEVGVYH